MVDETVEERDRWRLAGQEVAPLLEGPVAGDGQAAPFVSSGDETEEELGAGVIKGSEADLVTITGGEPLCEGSE